MDSDNEKTKRITRRKFLGVSTAAAAGGVVGGIIVGAVGGYLAGQAAAPPAATTTVTTTKTATQTVTTTQTAATATVTSTVTQPATTVTQPVTTTVTTTRTVAPEAEVGYTSLITLNVNGVDYALLVDNRWSLADVLREKLGLTGTKTGCDRGECGSCAVLVDGVPMLSCMLLACSVSGSKITTIEGIGTVGNLDKLQASFVNNEGIQCGMCIPGIIVVSKALLEKNPKPTEEEVKEALSGNLCKCGNWPFIVKSVLEAAK
ncbi:MAG: (2Fe-2S)-binding protein [Nitrososphaerales archaeon]